jgi:hypothetical protein
MPATEYNNWPKITALGYLRNIYDSYVTVLQAANCGSRSNIRAEPAISFLNVLLP